MANAWDKPIFSKLPTDNKQLSETFARYLQNPDQYGFVDDEGNKLDDEGIQEYVMTNKKLPQSNIGDAESSGFNKKISKYMSNVIEERLGDVEGTDFGTLTETELNDKKGLMEWQRDYGEITSPQFDMGGATRASLGAVNFNLTANGLQLSDDIKNQVAAFVASRMSEDKATKQELSDFVMGLDKRNTEGNDGDSEARAAFQNTLTSAMQGVINHMQPAFDREAFYTPVTYGQPNPDLYKDQIGVVTGLTDEFATKADKDNILKSFLGTPDNDYDDGTLKGDLQEITDDRMSGLYSRAEEGFKENIRPQLQASQNIKGFLNSGDTTELEASEASRLQGDLESMRGRMETFDKDFYFNSAYNASVKELMDKNVDYATAIGNERSRVMTARGTKFQDEQDDLNYEQFERFADQNYTTALNSQEARLRRDKNASDSASSKNLWGNIGGAVGGIAGAYVGGPGGAMAGYQAGSTIGKSAA